MADQRRALTVTDRTTIEVRLADGRGIRRIACSLGRSAGVASGKVNRNGGRDVYRAGAATDRAAAKRALTGRKPSMAPDGPRFTEAARPVGAGWWPEQVSGRRKRNEDGLEQSSGLRVSHEAICAAIHALPRGELRRELVACLRYAKPCQ